MNIFLFLIVPTKTTVQWCAFLLKVVLIVQQLKNKKTQVLVDK